MSVSRWHFSGIALVMILVASGVLGEGAGEGKQAYLRGDYVRALELWAPLAKGGDAEAQFGLGVMYERGQGVRRDYPRAALLYRRSAEQGFAAAQFNLGSAYEAGRGLARDRSAAATWWKLAADGGFARAQYNLGTLYYYGWGVEQDRARAMEWFRRAAQQGDPGAQKVLATLADVPPATTQSATKKAPKTAPEAPAPISRPPEPVAARPVASTVPRSPGAALRGEPWLRRQEADAYTLQLFANWTRQSLERFVVEHGLAGDLAVYETRYEGRPWFGLLYGIYDNAGAAQKALAALSPRLRVMGAWPRRFAEIHQILEAGAIAARGLPEAGAVGLLTPLTRSTKRPPAGSPTSPASMEVTRPEVAARPPAKSAPAARSRVAEAGEAAPGRDEAWILGQDAQHYTVQVFGDDNLASVRRFEKKSGLAGQLAHFRFDSKGRAWFSVIYGSFPEAAAAREALAALPKPLRRWSPWVRRFGAIHRLIGNRERAPAATTPPAAPSPSPQGLSGRGRAALARGQALFNRGRYEAAFALWQPLAADGVSEAQYSLGFMHESGWGVERDNELARRWYALAADQGHVRAQYNLGLMQVLGRDVDRDVAAGLRWIRKAAEAGHAPAREFLAAAYRGGGYGLKQSTKLAAFWSQDARRN